MNLPLICLALPLVHGSNDTETLAGLVDPLSWQLAAPVQEVDEDLINYSFLELQVERGDVTDTDDVSYKARYSIDLDERFVLGVGLGQESFSTDLAGVPISLNRDFGELGVLYHYDPQPDLSLFLFSFLQVGDGEISTNAVAPPAALPASVRAIESGIGLRSRLNDTFEVYVSAAMQDATYEGKDAAAESVSDDLLTIEAGARIYTSDMFALKVGARRVDSDTYGEVDQAVLALDFFF